MARRTDPAPKVLLVAIFLATFGVYLISPVVYYGDGRLAGPTAASLVTSGDLGLAEYADLPYVGGYQTTVIDGEPYDFYPWTRSLFAVPFAAMLSVGHALGVTPSPSEAVRSDTWEPALLLAPGAFATALAVTAAALLAWRQTRDPAARRRVTIVVGVGLAFTTGYWSTASRGMWQHGPACFWLSCTLLAAWSLVHGRAPTRAAVCLGAAAMAAALTRPTFVFFLAAFAVWLAFTQRSRALAAMVGAAAVAAAVTAVDLASFGSMAMPYYDLGRAGGQRPDPIWAGIAGTIASPSRGILVYMPAAVLVAGLGLYRALRDGREPTLRRSVALATVALVAFTSVSAEGWWAGHSFGARFAIDALPVLAFLAVPAIERLVLGMEGRVLSSVVAALALWSLFVHAQGAIVRETSCWNVAPVDVDLSRSQVWTVADAQATAGVRWVLHGNSPLDTDCDRASMPQ